MTYTSEIVLPVQFNAVLNQPTTPYTTADNCLVPDSYIKAISE